MDGTPRLADAPGAIPRFYPGWLQVVLAAAAMTATLPGRTYGLGLVKEPLRADLGLGDVRFGWLNFWAVILGSAIVLPVGRAIDRFGSRRVLAAVCLGLAAATFAMSRATDEASLAVSLTAVRGLGQGALSVAAIALVGKWFRRRTPLAMGLFAVLLGVGFVISPFVLKPLIAADGWRAGWAALAAAVAAYGIIAAMLARSSPESVGVPPDAPADPVADSGPGTRLLAALRTFGFWAYTLAGAAFNFALSAVTLDVEPLLKERGIDPVEGQQTTLAAMFLCGLPANLAAGWLARRVSLPKLLAAGAAATAASLAVFPFVGGLAGAAGFAGMFGVAGGFVTVAYFAVYGRAFGRGHLGGIQAAAQVVTVFASALGPVALAHCRESFGRTDAFFFTVAATCAALAAVCVLVPWPASRR